MQIGFLGIGTDAVVALHHRIIIVDKIKDLAGATIAQLQAMLGLSSDRTRSRQQTWEQAQDTFETHLSKGGVLPRTTQAAMRHSTIDLTMFTYTDPRQLQE